MRVSYLNACAAGLAAVLLAACSSTPRLPDDKTIQVNMLLDEVASQYTDGRQCLPTALYSNVDTVSERYLIFRGRTGKAWLNKLRHKCPGLRRDDTLLFKLHGARACDMDRVSVIDRSQSWRHAGPTCTLGKFKPIPPDYIERIDEVLRSK